MFGVLKQCWRILKTGIRLQSAAAIEQIWLTCCALHNYLLEHDGFDQAWVAGGECPWQARVDGQGLHDIEDLESDVFANLPMEQRTRHVDLSGMAKPDMTADVDEEASHFNLRWDLIAHFTYRLNNGRRGSVVAPIVWPQRSQ